MTKTNSLRRRKGYRKIVVQNEAGDDEEWMYKVGKRGHNLTLYGPNNQKKHVHFPNEITIFPADVAEIITGKARSQYDKKYHLLKDFGLHKSIIMQNFMMARPVDVKIAKLLNVKTQYYTLLELFDLKDYFFTPEQAADVDLIGTADEEKIPFRSLFAVNAGNRAIEKMNQIVDEKFRSWQR